WVPLQVAEHGPRRERSLAHRGCDARVGTCDDVAGGEDAGTRRLQILVDDDGTGAVELDLTPNELGTRCARDLHDEAARLHAPLLTVAATCEGDGLEALVTLHRCQLPSGELLDTRL